MPEYHVKCLPVKMRGLNLIASLPFSSILSETGKGAFPATRSLPNKMCFKNKIVYSASWALGIDDNNHGNCEYDLLVNVQLYEFKI